MIRGAARIWERGLRLRELSRFRDRANLRFSDGVLAKGERTLARDEWSLSFRADPLAASTPNADWMTSALLSSSSLLHDPTGFSHAASRWATSAAEQARRRLTAHRQWAPERTPWVRDRSRRG